MTKQVSRHERIAMLNDCLRHHFIGGQVYCSSGVAHLPEKEKAQVLAAVQSFDAFDEDNDPHKEHDFGAVEVNGERFYFKVDYYDVDMRYASDDPSDPAVTKRVMTIMHSSEY